VTDQFIYKPIEVVQDKRLTPLEQDYLCVIAGLEKNGKCTASNKWLADYFGVKRPRAVEVIGNLKKKKFIKTTEKKYGGKTIERTITIIDLDSKKSLLSDSKKLPARLVRNSDFDSKKSPTHKTKEKINNKTNGEPPLPADGQAARRVAKSKSDIAKISKKFGKKPKGQPKTEAECQRLKTDMIKRLKEDEVKSA